MDSDTRLYCLDAADGQQVWQFQSKSHTESSPFVTGGRVYFGAGFDGVYCVDASTGEQVWHFAGHHVDSSPAVANGLCFFGSGGAGQEGEINSLFALKADTGEVAWQHDYKYPVWGAPAIADGQVLVGIGNGNVDLSDDDPYGAVECLDAATGASVWLHEVKDSVLGAVALVDGDAYFGSRDGDLYCLDAATGAEVFRFATSPEDDPMAIVSSPAVSGGQVIFGCEDGKLRSIDKQTGDLVWEFDAGSLDALAPTDARILPSPAVAGGRIFCGADNYFFFCLGQAQ
jgi:outer membrane protein assembly factor BamB